MFSNFKPDAKVIGHVPVRTSRLDDLTVISDIDMLKVDMQGTELAVFQNARENCRRPSTAS